MPEEPYFPMERCIQYATSFFGTEKEYEEMCPDFPHTQLKMT
jgi:hypothetical protein